VKPRSFLMDGGAAIRFTIVASRTIMRPVASAQEGNVYSAYQLCGDRLSCPYRSSRAGAKLSSMSFRVTYTRRSKILAMAYVSAVRRHAASAQMRSVRGRCFARAPASLRCAATLAVARLTQPHSPVLVELFFALLSVWSMPLPRGEDHDSARSLCRPEAGPGTASRRSGGASLRDSMTAG
jgi:hypothetical protein